MKLADVDWGSLRGTLVVVVVSLIVCIAVLGVSSQYAGNKQADFKRANSKLLGVRGRYQTVDEEERIIETFLPRYLALEERGVIGREYRLDWIDALRSAADELRLPELRYTIGTQQAYDPGFLLEEGAFDVYASEMTLQLGLLHEEDLPALFALIDRNVRGLHRVSRCSISRTGAAFVQNPTQANLHATCTIEWLTVRQPPGDAST